MESYEVELDGKTYPVKSIKTQWSLDWSISNARGKECANCERWRATKMEEGDSH